MPRFFPIDAGGVARRIRRFFAFDNGGVRRLIRRGFLIHADGVGRLFYLYDVIALASTLVTASATAPTDATANLRIDSDGNQYQGSNTLILVGPWITPLASATDYAVRATAISGTVTTGAVGVWLPLTVDRSWQVQFTGNNGNKTTVLQLDFALIADTSAVVYSQSITMLAEVSP